MILVTIELLSARTKQRTLIGAMSIANDATGTGKNGNYNVSVFRKHANGGVTTDVLRTGRVENYPRLAYNVWRLVARALKSAFPEEG